MLTTRSAVLVGLLQIAGLAAGATAQPDVARATEPVASYRGHKVLRVTLRTPREFQTVLALTDDIWTHTVRMGRPVEFRVTPEQFAAVVASGLQYQIIINDVQAAVDAEAAEIRRIAATDDPSWYLNYHNYADTKAYYQALAAANPGICTYQVLGTSVQNREIFGLRITGPGSAENRSASLWIGGQHAREWVNIPVPTYHAEKLLTDYATDPHVRYLVDNHEFFFVATMNPDGYEYTWTNQRLWRKNRRSNAGSGTGCNNFGVDLNRNWGYQWGVLPQGGSSSSCSSDTYRGPSAFSEPETRVIRDFVIANPRIRSTMDWHSYGQLVMSPWGYTEELVTPPSQAALFQSLDDQMAAAILGVHGRVYEAGPIGPTLYIANGCSVDWSWGDRGVLGFTIELRSGGPNGFDPPPADILPNCQETWPAFLVIANHLTPCYANCDASTIAPALNVNDFSCFLNLFAAGGSDANCDGSSIPPVLNVNDFTCFVNKFAVGCP